MAIRFGAFGYVRPLQADAIRYCDGRQGRLKISNRKQHPWKNFAGIVGEKGVLTAPLDLASYAFDGTTSWQSKPDVVVFPTTAEQVFPNHEAGDGAENPGHRRAARAVISAAVRCLCLPESSFA